MAIYYSTYSGSTTTGYYTGDLEVGDIVYFPSFKGEVRHVSDKSEVTVLREDRRVGSGFRLPELGGKQGWEVTKNSSGWCDGTEYIIKVDKKGKKSMSNKIKDLFKSKEQKLLEKYVYNGEGINWSSEVLQEVLVKTLKDALVALAEEKEKEEKETK